MNNFPSIALPMGLSMLKQHQKFIYFFFLLIFWQPFADWWTQTGHFIHILSSSRKLPWIIDSIGRIICGENVGCREWRHTAIGAISCPKCAQRQGKHFHSIQMPRQCISNIFWIFQWPRLHFVYALPFKCQVSMVNGRPLRMKMHFAMKWFEQPARSIFLETFAATNMQTATFITFFFLRIVIGMTKIISISFSSAAFFLCLFWLNKQQVKMNGIFTMAMPTPRKCSLITCN